MRFIKMHGLGNDYIFLDLFNNPEIISRDLSELARKMSDRHRGIGGDGIILICPPSSANDADVLMRIFNSDGSEAEMCGNGIRCLARYFWDNHDFQKNRLRVETGRGVLLIRRTPTVAPGIPQFTVDMGVPVLDPARIPVDISCLSPGSEKGEYLVHVPGGTFAGRFVSMGNPHMVIFSDEPQPTAQVSLEIVGPELENAACFPERSNIHFASVISRNEVRMRTWERGAGITLACGTGACAVTVAGILAGKLDRDVQVHLPGGTLRISWPGENESVQMTGPAEYAFAGEWHNPA